MEIEVGTDIGGKYRLTRLLGRGGMGQVWLARHRTLDQDVAIKLMTRFPDEVDGEDEVTALARFQQEAQVAASLSKRTRNIVAVTDHGYEDGNPYLVMERLEGEGLDHLLDREHILPPSRVSAIMTQAARGLAAAHAEGVIHRDLKPANVFLTKDEEGQPLVKLLDFGIARLERHGQTRLTPALTDRGVVLGTPHYMSPEHARGLEEIDRYCDLWALSVVAYEALTGELPFDGRTPEDTIVRICTETPKSVREHRPSLPVALDGFFARAFSRRVAARFSSAEELAAAFASAVAQVPETTGAVGERTQPIPLLARAEPMPPLPTSSPRRIAFGVLGLVAVLSVAGVVVRLLRHDERGTATREETSSTPSASTGVPTPPPPSTAASAPLTTSVPPSSTARSTAAPTARHLVPTGPTTSATATATTSATATATTSATATATAAPVDKGAIF